mgnify:CR=1 FL=1
MKKKDLKLLPCTTCPWRTDKDATSIPQYIQEKAEWLLNTVGKSDDLRPIMACHGSMNVNMRACNGYLAREGWSNINVRILLAQGKIANPDKVADVCEANGIELEPDYPTVLEKLTASANVL